MTPCIHDKCYSLKLLCSIPPQVEWICRKCDKEGFDSLEDAHVRREYEYRIMKKHGPFLNEVKE